MERKLINGSMTIFSIVISIMFLACSNDIEVNKENRSTFVAINNSSNESNLKKNEVLKGRVSLLLPDDFGLMPNEMLLKKYPASNRPTEVYSSINGTVSIAVNHTSNEIKLEQLPELLPVFEKQFATLYPSIKWHKKELTKINGRDFIILAFDIPAADMPIYNLMAVSSLDGRMLMGSFNCPVGMKKDWKGTANEIINSIKILK